ncbi:E8 early protein [Bos taurus papillomavirus 34]|nr:E8 early protein [Bos taurus papillomavirus 34]
MQNVFDLCLFLVVVLVWVPFSVFAVCNYFVFALDVYYQ